MLQNEFANLKEELALNKAENEKKISQLEKELVLNNAENDKRISHLEEIIKTTILHTCDEYASFGINQNGEYLIDPDGQQNGNDPIKVNCTFVDGVGTTIIQHDTENLVKVEDCDSIGCFKQPINYSIPTSQLEALKALSVGCEQQISIGCYSAPLYSYFLDKNLAGWLDYTG